ncbi:YHS domain-containing (seleno)protein [Spirosoma montaniterrae]|uniref:YHS domain protein n=1 Tax=Spirosoma montaniterrae TaxID=1178516 RepID=A0A1P9WSF9_9BACT|nr:YHS domain-containing (seleno)protein [Spirosoma montaniterrae]AQG78302.1 YHS domain protein [Spirosoma montaniterrae]
MKPSYFLLLLCIGIGLSSARAQSPNAQRQTQFNLAKNLAISGYDPVSYFDGKPREGRADMAVTYKGVTYHFANAANANRFKKSPATYEPAYGGWCAYAMGATGEKVDIDPETYKITNGRLYLFYNRLFNNTLPKWNKDETNLARQADANWLKFYR